MRGNTEKNTRKKQKKVRGIKRVINKQSIWSRCTAKEDKFETVRVYEQSWRGGGNSSTLTIRFDLQSVFVRVMIIVTYCVLNLNRTRWTIQWRSFEKKKTYRRLSFVKYNYSSTITKNTRLSAARTDRNDPTRVYSFHPVYSRATTSWCVSFCRIGRRTNTVFPKNPIAMLSFMLLREIDNVFYVDFRLSRRHTNNFVLLRHVS